MEQPIGLLRRDHLNQLQERSIGVFKTEESRVAGFGHNDVHRRLHHLNSLFHQKRVVGVNIGAG